MVCLSQYCDKMRKNGSWGGQPELVAVSQCYQVDITLHQLGLPANKMMEHSSPKGHIHLAYHQNGQEHYNSVRRTDDVGPASNVCVAEIESEEQGSGEEVVAELEATPALTRTKAKKKSAMADEEDGPLKSMEKEPVMEEAKAAPKKRGRPAKKKAVAKEEVEVEKEDTPKRATKAALKEVSSNKVEEKGVKAKAPAKKATAKKTTAKKATAKKTAVKKTVVNKTAVKKATGAKENTEAAPKRRGRPRKAV